MGLSLLRVACAAALLGLGARDVLRFREGLDGQRLPYGQLAGALRYVLTQSGAALTGAWSAGSGGGGTLTGNVTGHAVTFRLVQTTPGCAGQFDGYAVTVPYFGDLVFYYSGRDCLGPHVNGSGFGQRAPLGAQTR